MSSRSSKHKSQSGGKKNQSASSSKTKTDDWTEITDAEERRRIQNRIAQRKFREKARDQKERSERDARNQEHAGSSYRIPDPEDVAVEEDLSGLPWGGPNLRIVVARGHETASQQGSRRASDQLMDDQQYLAPFGGGYQEPQPTTSWDGRDSSGADERYSYGGSPFYYPDYDNSGGSSAR